MTETKDQPGAKSEGTPSLTPAPPSARIVRTRRWSLAWLVPLAVVAGLIALGVQASRERPMHITIRFAEGSGLRPGDPVSCRGVLVGEVASVRLAADARSVLVEVDLDRVASTLAVEGTRFWVVRPEVSLRGVSGLDALLGPRSIACEPGALTGSRTTTYTGLDKAPPLPDPADGSLVLVLHAARRGSLGPGSLVTYRDIEVGHVLHAGLVGDARAVELTIAIGPVYAPLIRENTRFFSTSGITADWGLFSGFDLKADSLESVVAGGIGLATPTRAGVRVGVGHVFELATKADSDWLEWEPEIPLHSE